MLYTHNLSIFIVDSNDNKIENAQILQRISQEIDGKYITHPLSFNGGVLQVRLQWKKLRLTRIQRLFMGEFFTYSAYEQDNLNYDHTKATLGQIEDKLKTAYQNNDWHIVFHISRILSNRFPMSYDEVDEI